MKTTIRTALAVLALTVLFPTKPVHAQDLCIPLLTCPTNPPAQDAPEISGSMLSTGLALVSGMAMMFRGRRRA